LVIIVEPTNYMTRSPSASENPFRVVRTPLTYPQLSLETFKRDQVNMETVDRVTVRCLAKSEHFERKLGKRFVVSDNVSQRA
jgi:hypothetical protein